MSAFFQHTLRSVLGFYALQLVSQNPIPDSGSIWKTWSYPYGADAGMAAAKTVQDLWDLYHGSAFETFCVDLNSTPTFAEKLMELEKLDYDLTVCKVASIADLDLNRDFFFIGKTDEEISLVCLTRDAPRHTTAKDDGWKGFRIQGVLDFSLIGILSKLSGILAKNKIGIFAVSTFNTDYILVKSENFSKAMQVLEAEGYDII